MGTHPVPQSNILISDSTPPRAVLADFGLTRVMTYSVKMSSKEHGTTSFMAPELLLPGKFGLYKEIPSKEADIYALGMTMYQVLTGEQPFFPRRVGEVVHAVISGERPPKPENAEEIGMTEAVWDLLRDCWKEDRTARPTATEVLRKFCEIAGEGKTDHTSEGFPVPLSNPCDRGSVISRCTSSTAIPCE